MSAARSGVLTLALSSSWARVTALSSTGNGRGFELEERVHELVDGVVGAGLGAVAAAVGGGEAVVGVGFLGGLDVELGGLAVAEGGTFAVGVDDEVGAHEVGAILEQPG